MNAPVLFPTLLAINGSLLAFLHTMKGPEFLGLFFGWFIVVWVTVWVLRLRGFDNPATTLLGLLCFEAPGVARIIIGSFHGQQNWGFLILMMMIGSLFFILRAKHFSSNDSGGGASSCSSVSSCSSGGGGGCGGGGGGCGGCGGS